MLRGLPLYGIGLLFIILGGVALDQVTSVILGIAMIIGGYKLYQQKRVNKNDYMSSSGIATIIAFIGLIMFGVMLLAGSFSLPLINVEINKTLMMWTGAVIVLGGYLDVNFKRR